MTAQDQTAQEIKKTTLLNPTGILPQKFTPQTQGVRTNQFQKQRITGRVSQTMGRQRNNPQMKRKGEVSETMLTEKEATQLSDTKFKQWLSGSSLSSQRTTRNYRETTMTHCKLY